MCKDLLTNWLGERERGAMARLAEETGLSPGHLHALKSGKVVPTTATALKLERGTGIRAAVWLGLEKPDWRRKTDKRKAGAQ